MWQVVGRVAMEVGRQFVGACAGEVQQSPSGITWHRRPRPVRPSLGLVLAGCLHVDALGGVCKLYVSRTGWDEASKARPWLRVSGGRLAPSLHLAGAPAHCPGTE